MMPAPGWWWLDDQATQHAGKAAAKATGSEAVTRSRTCTGRMTPADLLVAAAGAFHEHAGRLHERPGLVPPPPALHAGVPPPPPA